MGAVRELFAGNALKLAGGQEGMDRKVELWGNPGDLLHAILQGCVIAEISDATVQRTLSKPASESQRGPGFQRVRAGRAPGSDPFRSGR